MLSSTPALIVRYAKRYDAALAGGIHQVSSPLGAWLLLALVAGAADPSDRAVLEDALGTDVHDAGERATALLERPHPAVASAVVLWYRREFLVRAFDRWAAALPPGTETGPVPTQEQADAWARRVTRGIIEAFPGPIEQPEGPTAVVVANALATRVRWLVPFALTDAAQLGGEWTTRVGHALETTGQAFHRMLIAETTQAGLVGGHGAYSGDGLLVVSVIADAAVAEADVHAAAHDVALTMAREGSTTILAAPTSSVRRSLFDLPLGDGHAWTITERSIAGDDSTARERYRAVLPAWSARGDYDLLGTNQSLGFDAAARALERLGNPEFGPFTLTAVQSARARFDWHGFEAAAITATIALLGFDKPPRAQRCWNAPPSCASTDPTRSWPSPSTASAKHPTRCPQSPNGMASPCSMPGSPNPQNRTRTPPN
jgi:hypothetical protein